MLLDEFFTLKACSTSVQGMGISIDYVYGDIGEMIANKAVHLYTLCLIIVF